MMAMDAFSPAPCLVPGMAKSRRTRKRNPLIQFAMGFPKLPGLAEHYVQIL